MTEEITTIKVWKKDRRWLEALFGQPTHVAFHAVTQLCPHPEKERIYTSATVNRTDMTGAVKEDPDKNVEVNGFRCGACGRYVFQDPRAN